MHNTKEFSFKMPRFIPRLMFICADSRDSASELFKLTLYHPLYKKPDSSNMANKDILRPWLPDQQRKPLYQVWIRKSSFYKKKEQKRYDEGLHDIQGQESTCLLTSDFKRFPISMDLFFLFTVQVLLHRIWNVNCGAWVLTAKYLDKIGFKRQKIDYYLSL